MKLKEYYEDLTKLVEARPEVLNFDVIYSKDDEGNYYQPVNYTVSVCYFDQEDEEMVFTDNEDDLEYKPNAVCLN